MPGMADRRSRPGAVLVLKVAGMGLDGDGLGKAGDYVLLIPGAIRGETVRVQVESAGRKYGRAGLLEVLEPSPHRVQPRCRHFGACGGCAWQHIAYPEQLRLKEEFLRSALEHFLPGVDFKMRPMAPIDPPWGFRDKAHFVCGPGPKEGGGEGIALGHYAGRSREFIPVEECPVHAPAGNRAAFRLLELLRRHGMAGCGGDSLNGVARHLLLRVNQKTGEAQATLVAARRKFRGLEELAVETVEGPGGISGFYLSANRRPGTTVLGGFTRKLRGRKHLLERIAGVAFLVSPHSFFQTNIRAAEALVEIVLAAIPAEERGAILDLYAGVGLFSLPLAKRGHRVVAIEENESAIADGLESLRFNSLRGVRFLKGPVEKLIARAAGERDFSSVILDPPREGCSERILNFLGREVQPRRLLYVSCNPQALGRDLAILRKTGYLVTEVKPVDMFAHTAHLECVAIVRRQESPDRFRRPRRRFR